MPPLKTKFSILFLALSLSIVLYSISKNSSFHTLPTHTKPSIPPVTKQNIYYGKCAWSIYSTTNIEFLITDESGKRTGYLVDQNKFVFELSDSSYGHDPGFGNDSGSGPPTSPKIYFGQNDPFGKYQMKIYYKDSGEYTADIGILCDSKYSNSLTITGKLTTGQIDTYELILPEGSINKTN